MTKTERIAQMLEKNEGMQVEVIKVSKGGVMMQAIAVGSGNVKPTVYPDKMEGSDEEIVDEIVNLAVCGVPSFEIEKLTEWEKAKKDIRIAVRPVLNDNIATVPFLDVEAYFEITVENDGRAKVTKEMARLYGVNMQEIMLTAMLNTRFSVMTLSDIIRELSGNELKDNEQCPLFVASTMDGLHGASFMCNPNNLMAVADQINSDLVVIPSSIHEILIIPYSKDASEIKSMVMKSIEASYHLKMY